MKLPAHLKHLAQGKPEVGHGRDMAGMLLRGVIVEVYLPNDPRLAERRTNITKGQITCDVITYQGRRYSLLRDVPILRMSAGATENTSWVPRAASVDLVTGVLRVDGQGPKGVPVPPSAPQNMDGDHVIIGFLHGDAAQPVILGQLDHPRNNTTPAFTDAQKYKEKKVLRNWVFGMTTEGNVEIDALTASAGVVVPAPLPTEAPAVPAAGNMNIVLAPGTKLTVNTSLNPSPTREPTILGTSFLQALNVLMAALIVWLDAVDTVLLAQGISITAANTAFKSAINTFTSSISTSLFAGKPFLSVHVEVD